ncbi:MAG TPA: flagellar motor switch protein FliM [Pyrinomonadaceae bacterium]|jgi:flagellar motor switch protein FliM|nr:flagellar motor switch protein FliM [Pyrinomonadaceae bacterium]
MTMNEQENLLTSEEMDALLPESGAAGAEREKKNRIVSYNFRRPDRWSKEQIRGLYMLHDLFAQSLSSSLPLHLHSMAEVNLISVDQNPYSEFMRSLPEPTTLFTVAVEPEGGVFAIDLSPTIAFPIIDRMLGGNGAEKQGAQKVATDLELKILEAFMSTVVESYSAAWEPITKIKAKIVGRETRPQMMQIVAPNETVVIVSYHIQVGDVRGTMSFCLPTGILEPVIDKFIKSSYAAAEHAPNHMATLSHLKNLAAVRLPVTAELAETPAAISDLAALMVGDVIKTNHRVDMPVNVKIGGLTKFCGSVASFDSRMVVQVTRKTESQTSDKLQVKH